MISLERLLQALADPRAYPGEIGPVEVHQTHISAVFLVGTQAYKIKKPVELGFLDFRTLQSRHHFCQEEVRLNRRLAPTVYRGVVPITQQGDRLIVNGSGEAVEWAVWMQRLPAEASLLERLHRGEVRAAQIEDLAHRLARFHATATRGPTIAAAGSFQAICNNVRENFLQARTQVGSTITADDFEQVRQASEAALAHLRSVIDARCQAGCPCDGHGDLHSDHIYLFPDRPYPDDVQIIDCIEFNDRFRHADPVADMAFLVMDLRFQGRADLADRFATAYFTATGDEQGRLLVPFYAAYRAVVRAKVEGMELLEREIPADERHAAEQRARQHWALARELLMASS